MACVFTKGENSFVEKLPYSQTDIQQSPAHVEALQVLL